MSHFNGTLMIEQYKVNQNLDYSIVASKALDVISDYNYWDINKYRDLFGSLKDDGLFDNEAFPL